MAGLNLDLLIEIDDKEVSVYPTEDAKPPIGKGLNKKAIITFDNVWPGDNAEDLSERSQQEIADFIEVVRARVSAMDGAEFIEYNPDNGRLLFSVQHFSKYKLIIPDGDRKTGLLSRKRFVVQGSSLTESARKKQSVLVTYSWEKNETWNHDSSGSLKENFEPFAAYKHSPIAGKILLFGRKCNVNLRKRIYDS